MSKHYIYEIFGKKIGATNDVARRMKEQNAKEGEYRIIEEHTNAKVASQREMELQREFGYPVDRIAYWKTLRWQKKALTKKAQKKRVANTDYKTTRVKGATNTD
jgi:nucleoside-specific outer membrane channel protein Tsx